MLRRDFSILQEGIEAYPVASNHSSTLPYAPNDSAYFQHSARGRFNRYRERFSEAHSRFSSLLDFSDLRFRCLVVGAGAGGRQTCMLLASMGIPFVVVDFDKVEEANLGTQGFKYTDVGQYKVDAVCRECNSLYGSQWSLAVGIPSPVQNIENWYPVVFMCVDSMDVRKYIARRCEQESMLFIDSRMGAMTMDIFLVDRPELYAKWLSEWYPDSEAYASPCTAKTTYFVSAMSAGWRVSAFARWLTRRDVPHTLHYSLLDEMHTTLFDPPAVNPS